MPSTYTDRLQGITTSVAVKAPVRVTTTTAIVLSGEQTIDGVALSEGDRVLVKNQTNSAENGIWEVGLTAWSRTADWDGALDAVNGTIVSVTEGTADGTFYKAVCADDPIVIGTSDVTFELVTFATAIAADSITTVELANNAVETANILNDAVTNAKLADDAVDTAQLADTVFSGLGTVTPGTEDSIVITDDSDSDKPKLVLISDVLALNSSSVSVPVRQTVLNGPVDSDGLPNFGGSTGTTTVTASGTLIVTAANGFNISGAVNRVGQISNPSWTGLSTNGNMYLYLDVAADGSCTTGSGTLAPTYRFGGSDVTTNGQFTFNIQEMVGKVGNGSVATQTYRVYVGQVFVSSNVVSTITWYALQGKYVMPWTATLPAANSSISFSHNIGTTSVIGDVAVDYLNTTTSQGYSVGDIIYDAPDGTGSAGVSKTISLYSLVSGTWARGNTLPSIAPKTGGAYAVMTNTAWSYRLRVDRGW